MLHLSDGRDHGYMWDTGRKLKCDTGLRDGTTVFFMLPGRYDPIPMAVENGTVPVPDEAWHKEGKFIVFLYAMDSTGRYTRTSRTFTVKYAPKPNNYAYTPTEVLDWHTLEKRLEDLEGEGLANAVAAYLQENPVEAGATAEEAAQIEQNKTDIATLDRTKLAASELPNAVNEALAQAKASGAFDGQPGADGKDYVLTEADKQEIAEQAAELVEVPDADIPTTLPNPNALTFTGAATGTYDGSAPLTVNIPEGGGGTGAGKGISNTYGEAVELINTTIEISADEPVTEIILNLPENATKLHHFSISVALGKPTNEHTAGRSMMYLFGSNIWYWNMGNTQNNTMYMWALVDMVRRITYCPGNISNNNMKFNAQTMKTHMDSAPSLTESQKLANNTFRLWLEKEYAGTATIEMRGYN